MSLSQVEAEAHGFPGQLGKIVSAFPADFLLRFICAHRRAVVPVERSDGFAFFIERLDAQFAR